MLNLIERVGLAATRALSIVGLAALLGVAVMTIADGTLRWLVNWPIVGVRDAGALAVAVAVSCCIPVGLMERSNITIRCVEPLFGARAAAVFEASAALIIAVLMALIAWQFTVHAGNLYRAGETTWILKIRTAPFWYGVAAILWCAFLVQTIVVFLDFARCFGRRTTGTPAPDQ
jgi:TRAP-type C4-dicarboxylate transport system permease small subunit